MQDNIYVVSFPRSGQHLLQSILKYVFDHHDLTYSFCEYYDCCNSVPCKHNNIICKNHDFNNDYEIITDNKYIILYRDNIILQLESYYRHEVKRMNMEYNYDNMISFINMKLQQYNNFKSKWVNNSNRNILKIEYYNLVNNPIDHIKLIMSHIRPTTILKSDIINKIPDLEFNEYGKGTPYNKINIINKISDELYQQIRLEIKCSRSTCNYLLHTDKNNNQGTHCCYACKLNGSHELACEHNKIS